MIQQKIPRESMVCDTTRGDGNIYFYDEYFEWINRSTGAGFRLRYESIDDIKVIRTGKNEVIITTKQQKRVSLFIYKVDTLLSLLYERINAVNGNENIVDADVSPAKNDKDELLNQLERLAKLHESGAISDEEFQEAKQKILK